MSKELEVSLVNYLCPVCGNIAEEGIIMNSLLSEEAAKEVKNLHGKNAISQNTRTTRYMPGIMEQQAGLQNL